MKGNSMESKITKITFAQIRNLGDYENMKVCAEADVHESEDPNEVMGKLKKWVSAQLAKGPYKEGERW